MSELEIARSFGLDVVKNDDGSWRIISAGKPIDEPGTTYQTRRDAVERIAQYLGWR